jgi:hypothetical protein
MSSSSSIHNSSNSDWRFSSNDDEMLFHEMDQEIVLLFQCVLNVFNLEDLARVMRVRGPNNLFIW